MFLLQCRTVGLHCPRLRHLTISWPPPHALAVFSWRYSDVLVSVLYGLSISSLIFEPRCICDTISTWMIIIKFLWPWNVGLVVTQIVMSLILFWNENKSRTLVFVPDFFRTSCTELFVTHLALAYIWSKSFLPFGSYFNIVYVGATPVVVLPVHVVSYNWNIVGDGRMEGVGAHTPLPLRCWPLCAHLTLTNPL